MQTCHRQIIIITSKITDTAAVEFKRGAKTIPNETKLRKKRQKMIMTSFKECAEPKSDLLDSEVRGDERRLQHF